MKNLFNMKQQILCALVAVLALPAISDAQIVDSGTAFTIRVGQVPSFQNRVIDGSAHGFTGNFTSGGGVQPIGTVADPFIAGAELFVNASDTFVVDSDGNFTYTLLVESAGRGMAPGDVGFGDLSFGPASGNGTGLFIGQNLTGVFNVDPEFGGAVPPNPFTPTNAVTQTHIAETAVLSVFDLDDGSLRGSDSVIGVGAFNGGEVREWQGFLGVTVTEGEDDIPAGTIPTGRIGAVTLTITGTVDAPVLLGDVDLNGMVNFLDIAPFIMLLSNNGFQLEADIDGNEVVNFLDIAPFIEILSGNTPSS